MQHSHVIKYLKGTKRRILLTISGAYSTASLQALYVITGNTPIHLKLMQDYDLRIKRRERRIVRAGETPLEVKTIYLMRWQEEWDAVETGRLIFGLLPDIKERLSFGDLNEVEHLEIQLLTGRGAFGDYLHKHNKREDISCLLL